MGVSVCVFVDRLAEGSETFVWGELRELAGQGHAVHVEAGGPAAHPDRAAAEGLEVSCYADEPFVVRLAALSWLVARHPLGCVADLLSRRRWRAEEPVRPLCVLAPVARRIARGGQRHVHAHFAAGAALDAMRVAALLGLPYSVMTHGYDVFQKPANLREKHERAAFAVSASDDSVRHVRELVGPSAARRVHRLVMGVDGERFRRGRPAPADRSVICVARLVEKKGIAHLLDAAALLRERGRPLDRLTIVGDGPLREALQSRIRALGLEDVVTLMGGRPPAEIPALLEDAAVLAMPAVIAADGDRDTMPVVVKEALAIELVVVASDVAGLPEVVRDAWGRLCVPGDAGALADALDELLALPGEQRRAMGAAGRAFVLRECSLAGQAARLAELIGAA